MRISTFTPPRNDGKTVYRLVVENVPVDAFWPVSPYNARGYFEKNSSNAYSISDLTAKKGAHRTIAIEFGGCDDHVENCLPIVAGWDYTVRLYRPRADILNGALEQHGVCTCESPGWLSKRSRSSTVWSR